jgi:hypothetical protein
MIRNGSNLRLGNAQKKVIADCRESIRSNATNRIPMVKYFKYLLIFEIDYTKRRSMKVGS